MGLLYSSNDILFLLVLLLPGLDMFYEVLSYSTGIHIWHNQNTISYLICLQHFKPKYFLLFCMILELVVLFFNIWKCFLSHQNLKFVRNPFGGCALEGREDRQPPQTLGPLSPRVPLDSCGDGVRLVWETRSDSLPLCSSALTCLVPLLCASEVLPRCSL